MQSFRQISEQEWIKGDYRPIAELRSETFSQIEQKFKVKFEDFYEDGLGDAKAASFISDTGTQFFIEGLTPFQKIIFTRIGLLNEPSTLAKNLDDILEMLELNSKDINFLHENIKLTPHELWRQDDNGHKFLIETFACKADAVKSMKEFESRLHKQTYWVEKSK